MDSIVTAAGVHRRYGEGDAAVDALAGVSVGFERGRAETQVQDGIGRFGWALDPEGNRFELWEPEEGM